MITNDISTLARDYKRRVPGRFMLVDGNKIEEKIGGQNFLVTKKIDGVMQLVHFSNGITRAFGTGGNETPSNIPCLTEVTELLLKKDIKSALFAAELYAPLSETGRERVCNVATAIADKKLHDRLRLAPFDLLEVNNGDLSTQTIVEKIDRIKSIFSGGYLISPVKSRLCSSINEIRQLYNSMVVNDGAEGLVVHSSNGFVYKVKPRHTIDVAIIGYTEGENDHREMVRDLLTAVTDTKGTLRQVVSVGSGITDMQRTNLFNRLKNTHVESDYLETDSRGVAFQMVHPEIVIEISAIDFVTENSLGEPKQNMLLEFNYKEGYKAIGKTTGVSLHSATFVRERPDKTVCPDDVRESQLTDLCEFSKGHIVDYSDLPTSSIIARRVFVKKTGLKTALHKFVAWKTNKEQTGAFPAYVLHHTDYNYSRNEPLKRDLRISNSRDQIIKLLDELIMLNIKKGWEEVI